MNGFIYIYIYIEHVTPVRDGRVTKSFDRSRNVASFYFKTTTTIILLLKKWKIHGYNSRSTIAKSYSLFFCNYEKFYFKRMCSKGPLFGSSSPMLVG